MGPKMSPQKTRKRTLPDDVDKTDDAKKKKDVFTDVDLKFNLMDPSTIFVGLDKFIEAADGWLNGEGDDVVQSYCRSSPECQEILQVLQAQGRKTSELQSVFTCLEKILLRIADDLSSKHYATGQTILRTILTSHSGLLHTTLNMKNKSSHIKSAIKLMISMVMLGTQSAKLVMDHVDIGHDTMLPLLRRRDTKDEEDVRTCFIHLIVAFLLSGDPDIVRRIIQTKGVMENALQGLQYDRVSTLQLLLSSVLEKVVLSPAVSKTMKVHLFTDRNLKELALLYAWKGPSKWKDSLGKKNKHKDDNEEMAVDSSTDEVDASLIAALASKLLTQVCTSYKHGIVFMDKTLGMSGRNNNHLMSAMLSHLSTMYGQPMVQQLVTGILSACPDQIQHFMQNVSSQMFPRETARWVNIVSFLCKIYTGVQKEVAEIKVKDVRSTEQLVKILLIYTCPSTHYTAMLTTAIKHKSILINYMTLRLAQQYLEGAVTVLRALDNTQLYSSDYRLECRQMYLTAVIKMLPDVMTMFSCWDKVTALQKATTLPADVQKMFELSGARLSDVLITIEQVLCLYQELKPTLLIDHSGILGKLLDGVLQEKEAERATSADDGDHVLKVYLLKLLAGTDAKRLPWQRKNTAGHTLLYQMLEMVTQITEDSSLSQAMMSLVSKLIESTGRFESHTDDLSLWLQCLRRFGSGALGFLSRVLMTYINNPYPYMDAVCDLQSQVAMETNSDSERSQAVIIADVLKMSDIDLEDGQAEYTVPVTKRFPFCPMLLVAVETVQNDKQPPKVVVDYVSALILHSFHLQVDPAPYCRWLKDSGVSKVATPVCDYINTWTRTTLTESQEIPTVQLLNELVRENETLALPADTLKISTRRNLLHLTYLFQILKKTTEKTVLKHMKTILKQLMLDTFTALEKSKDKTKSDANSTADALGFEPTSQVDQVSTSIRLVLEHPLVRQHFLCENIENQSSKKVSKIITDCVTCLLTAASKNSLGALDCIEFYFEKTATVVDQNQGKGDSGEGRSQVTFDQKMMELLLDVLKVLAEASDGRKCSRLLALLLRCNYTKETMSTYNSVLQFIIRRLSSSGLRYFRFSEDAAFSQMINCYVAIDDSDGDIMYEFLKRFPLLSVHCTRDCLTLLLSNLTKNCRLLQLMMQHNTTLTLDILKMIGEGEKQMFQSESLPIVLTCLKLTFNVVDCKDTYGDTCAKVVKKMKKQFVQLTSSDYPDNIEDLVNLVLVLNRSASLGTKLLSKLEKKLVALFESDQKPLIIALHHVQLLDMLLAEGSERRCTLARLCLKSLPALLEQKADNETTVEKVLQLLSGFTQELLTEMVRTWPDAAKQWPTVVTAIINHLYTSAVSLNLLTVLMPILYRSNDLDLQVTIATVVDLVTVDKQFVPVMFGQHGKQCKDAMVNLMCVLIELSPGSCHEDHVGVYLGAYSASLSNTDQKIMKLLRFYENNEVDFSSYRPFVWGAKGVELYELRKNLGPSLKETRASQVFDLLDKKLLHHSILNFPLRRKLQGAEIESAEYFKGTDACYDPCFLLPLFSHLLGPAAIVDCRKFVEKDCLGYVMAALSCHDENMRRVAMHVLDEYLSHVRASRIHEREQIVYLVELLQNSLPTSTHKLASIITQFFARAATLMLKLDDHMYPIINHFVLIKPSLDVQNIPEFFKLFNSSDLQYKVEQTWMLSLMQEGLRETADYRIFQKRFTFKLLLGFYDSVVADYQCQLHVLQILIAGCGESSVVKDLCQHHGFLVWLGTAINKLVPEKVQMVTLMTRLVHTLWRTLKGDNQYNQSTTKGEKPSENLSLTKGDNPSDQPLTEHIVPLTLCTQMMTCLKNLLFYLREVSEPVHILFTETLYSVVLYMMKLSHDARGHTTQTVSHNDIFLLLIQCQKAWTQSTLSSQTVQNILKLLGITQIGLLIPKSKKTGKVVGKRFLTTVTTDSEDFDGTSESAIDGTTTFTKGVDAPENMDNADSPKNKLSETILKIVLHLKSYTRYSSSVDVAAVDFVLLQWFLDQLHSNTNLGIDTLKQTLQIVDEKMFFPPSDSRTNILAQFLSSEKEQINYENLRTNLVMASALIADQYESHSSSNDSITVAEGKAGLKQEMLTSLNSVSAKMGLFGKGLCVQ